jgi:hypothetical protein
MRKLFILILICSLPVIQATAQVSSATAAVSGVAHPIDTARAFRIMAWPTDNLRLTTAQQALIRQYTWYIDSCRVVTVRQYHGTNSPYIYMMQVEHRRDSLYQRVLTTNSMFNTDRRKPRWYLTID